MTETNVSARAYTNMLRNSENRSAKSFGRLCAAIIFLIENL